MGQNFPIKVRPNKLKMWQLKGFVLFVCSVKGPGTRINPQENANTECERGVAEKYGHA